MDKYLAIDENGFPLIGEARVTLNEVGRELLANLQRNDNGSFQTNQQNDRYLVEAFDEPLVVQGLASTPTTLRLQFPYGYSETLNLATLRSDEWDRFHGRLNTGIPFVFNRTAQALLFDTVDSFDDDSITFQGKEFPVPAWLGPGEAVRAKEFWQERYQNKQSFWELGAPAPALADMLPRMKWPKSRVLVLGCGSGHDAAYFAQQGHVVTAVDFATEALQSARAKYATLSNINWLQCDIFNLPPDFAGAFDVVFEHTCYCAIDPIRRSQLVKTWLRCLAPRGHLLGVFFVNDQLQGPPFGGSEWEVRERLRKHFNFRFWGRWRQSPTGREGTELFVFAERK